MEVVSNQGEARREDIFELPNQSALESLDGLTR